VLIKQTQSGASSTGRDMTPVKGFDSLVCGSRKQMALVIYSGGQGLATWISTGCWQGCGGPPWKDSLGGSST
jgi:hypothetical protein